MASGQRRRHNSRLRNRDVLALEQGELIAVTGSAAPDNTILPETAPWPKSPCSGRMAPMRGRPSVLRARLACLPIPIRTIELQAETERVSLEMAHRVLVSRDAAKLTAFDARIFMKERGD